MTSASDMWAVGCIGAELVTGKRLFESEVMIDRYIKDRYVDSAQVALLNRYPKIVDIIIKCLVVDPVERISVWRLLELLGESDDLV